jgi:hypothetical protein
MDMCLLPMIQEDDKVLLGNIWFCCNHLFGGRQSWHLFVFQVSDGSGQVQIAIDASKRIHESTGFAYTSEFDGTRRFVIFGQWQASTIGAA